MAGASHRRVPIDLDPSGQPAVTMVTNVNGGVSPRTVVTPFSFQRSDCGAGCQRPVGSGTGTPPPRLRSKDFGPIARGRAVIPLPWALRPCTAGGLLGSKQAALGRWLCRSL